MAKQRTQRGAATKAASVPATDDRYTVADLTEDLEGVEFHLQRAKALGWDGVLRAVDAISREGQRQRRITEQFTEKRKLETKIAGQRGVARLRLLYEVEGSGVGFLPWLRQRKAQTAIAADDHDGTRIAAMTLYEFADLLTIGVETNSNPTLTTRSAIYAALLRDFQTAHAMHGQSIFCLELLTDSEYEARLANDGGADIIYRAEFLAWRHPETGESFHVCAVVGGFRLDRDAIAPFIYYPAEQAWEVFRGLAHRAGAHLPMQLRKAMPVEPHDAAAIWYTLLFWTIAVNEHQQSPPPNIRRALSFSPFLDSADAIELCNLTSENCAIPWPNNVADSLSPTIDDAERMTPPLDIASSVWVRMSDPAMKSEASVDSLRAMRNHAVAGKNADGTFGVDKAGRRWRKESAEARVVYYYRPSLRSKLALDR